MTLKEMSWMVKAAVAAGAVLSWLAFLGEITPLLAAAEIGVGWLRHLLKLDRRTVLHLSVTILYVAFVLVVSRRMARNAPCVAAANQQEFNAGPSENPKWALRLLQGAGLLLLVAGSFVCFAGMIQNVVKLTRSPRPMVITYPAHNAFSSSRNCLKQIGLAAHNYESRYQRFPGAGTFSETGRSHHSWMTFLLPYVDEGDRYQRIDLTADWTAPSNAAVFRERVACFVYPTGSGLPEPGAKGTEVLAGFAGNIRVLPPGRSLALREITDGTSNTILAGEVIAGRRVWGDPANLRDPARGVNDGPDGFGSPWRSSVRILMCDGAVRAVSRNIDPEVLRRLGTPASNDVDDADLGRLWIQ